MNLACKIFVAWCILAVSAKPNTSPDYEDDGEEEMEEKDMVIPEFQSTREEISGKLGADVSLPCDVDNLGGFTRLWRRQLADGSIEGIFTGTVKSGNIDKRLTLTESGTLRIEGLTLADAGIYICRLSTAETHELSHTVSVLAPPTAKASKALIVVSKGQPVTLQCETTGTPRPVTTWKRHDDEKKMFDGQKSLVGDSITISSVSREHSGVYECVATNSEGTEKAKVTLDVQYPPEIEVEKTSINSREGYDAELTCTVHAEPKAQVTWMKNNEPITIDDERVKVMKSGSKHLLSIKFVKTSDFGNYSCIAMNKIGETKAEIEVTGLPTPAFLKSVPVADGVKVQYQIESHDQVDEVQIKYRLVKVKDSKWEIKIMKPESTDDVIHTGGITINNLESGEMYEVVIQARNKFGWSRDSEAQKFVAETATEPPGVAQGVARGASSAATSFSSLLLLSAVATLLK